ncbi:MAG TPA: GNAT family protein [Candidatus Saccharimonadales bacterium]|nr:GNAT family protein [Candidatus Saccharimonadales bacterium]
MNEILLKIEDIELKTFTLDLANQLFHLIDKNRDQVGEWLIWVDKTISVEDVEKLIHEWNVRKEKGEGMNFGIWYKAKLIGYISYAYIDKENRKAGLAYWLDSDYQGKGIITKACKALIEYGFNELNLHRIEISCAEGNSKSRAIPERLGFTEEGIFRESELIRGSKLVDNHHYALLKQDWKK